MVWEHGPCMAASAASPNAGLLGYNAVVLSTLEQAAYTAAAAAAALLQDCLASTG